MLVSQLHRQFRDLLDKQDFIQSTRYIDLCIVWRRKLTGEILYRAGGKWDLLTKRFVEEDPDYVRFIDLEESQLEAAQWAIWWIQEFKAGRPRDFFSLFLIGDRGAGKTHFAVIFLVTLVIDCPYLDGTPAIAWQVSCSHAERDELDREIENNFPLKGVWYRYYEQPKHEYRFVHGPRIVNISADDAEDLKRGRVDYLVINEAQKMRKKVPAYAFGRLKDKGGINVLTGNAPTESKAQWILDLYDLEQEARQEGKSFPIRFLQMRSALNKTLDTHVASQVADVIRILDPRLAAADIDGSILRIGQPAYWEFHKTRNCRTVPNLGDITEEVTKKLTGRAYPYIAGVDFQDTPHMAAAVFKIFGTIQKPILWSVDEFVAEQATEDDLLDLIDDDGYTPDDLLFVGDASGQWQDGRHSKNGRDSFQVFKSRRWHIVPPVKPKDPKHRPKNPLVEQRIKLVNKLLASSQFMVDPHLTPKLAEALKECEMKLGRYGKVHPYGYYAHHTDAAGYVAWFISPKTHAPRREDQSLGVLLNRLDIKAI